MRVLCKLHRKGGSKIHFGVGKDRVEYHFKPLDPKASLEDDRIDHVAEVTDKAHLGRLLSIEGYELYDGPETSAAPSAAAAPKDSALSHGVTGNGLDASVNAAIAAADPTKAYIFVREGDMVVAKPIDLGPTAPAKQAKAQRTKAPKAAANGAKDPARMSKAELVEAATAKLGKKPHPSTSEKKLREILAS